MRNLSLFHTDTTTLPGPACVSAVSIDLDHGDIYIASERETSDGDMIVEVWKAKGRGGSINHDQACDEYREISLITKFTTPEYATPNPWSNCKKPPELASFRLLPDSRMLAFTMRGGEVATANMDDEIPSVDVVGAFESGILAASWSPDDSILVLITGDGKLILMTSTFDVITETEVHSTDFGEDSPINVGWGSKQTQFHGSLGKAAAQAQRASTVGSSPDDDGLPRISWRGDGAFFAVSSLSPLPIGSEPDLTTTRHRRRTLRFYSHAGSLQSTSEPTPGLEHVLSWRPSGNWIVSTQRYGFEGGGDGRVGRHDLVLFERNGLRRGEFNLESTLGVRKASNEPGQWEYKVREVSWSSDSSVLSVWIAKDTGDFVQLWTIGNYHWYLKHEILAPPAVDGSPGRFTSVAWHPEDALRIILTTASDVIQRSYAWETFSSRSSSPSDSGSVAVLDGATILLTPFRTQNIPPPMASHQLPIPRDVLTGRPLLPVHVAFSPHKDILASLWETGYIEVTNLRTRLGPGKGGIVDPILLWSGSCNAEDSNPSGNYRQVLLWNDQIETGVSDALHIVALGSGPGTMDFLVAQFVVDGQVQQRAQVNLPERDGRLLRSDGTIAWQSPSGEVVTIELSTEAITPVATFPEFCFEVEHVSPGNILSDPEGSIGPLYIGLSSKGKLYAGSSNGSRVLASNANSFTVASGFLIYTTTSHLAHFAPLNTLQALLSTPTDDENPLPEWETRRVERGSRIVTAVPSNMSLVLQMPRGNLETINPRPLVMKIVRQYIDIGNYAKAFSACRRHRIDLTVFVEHRRESFLSTVSSFLDQVEDVDYINLFLTSIGQSTLPTEVVVQTCDSIREELEKRDLKKYVNSILTAHVVKQPPDHEAGLSLLLRLKDSDPELVEDAVKYIIFLVDANKLFDIALGMYDFSLVLMIAQHSQKDPREYLPFLRELRALEKYYQRFKIDDHLRRHEAALRNLSLAGVDRFEEAMAYVERYQLYQAALSIWRTTNKYNDVLNVYGDWLFERREFKDAAFVFRHAGKPQKAMIAYEKALEWQELFDLAVQNRMSDEDLGDMAYRVADDLSSKKRYLDASRVLLDYRSDTRGAIIALVQGNHFSEARRQITLQKELDLLEEIVYPGALESRAQIAEEIHEMREQLRKQLTRIRELRVKKVEEPEAFFGVEDTELHNVDVMTDVSMAPTAFTRYTVAPSTASRTSKRSSRSKRKLERKVGSGRKGTVDEEEYLLKSVAKLVGRFNTTQNDAIALLPHLFQFTEEHREEGESLQEDLIKFGTELHEAVDEIWKKPDVEGQNGCQEGWAARMQETDKQRQIDPLDKVAKPELPKRDWNPKLSDIGGKLAEQENA